MWHVPVFQTNHDFSLTALNATGVVRNFNAKSIRKRFGMWWHIHEIFDVKISVSWIYHHIIKLFEYFLHLIATFPYHSFIQNWSTNFKWFIHVWVWIWRKRTIRPRWYLIGCFHIRLFTESMRNSTIISKDYLVEYL